jgi:hypothetical protein
MEGGRRRRVDPFSTFIQLVIMVEFWSIQRQFAHTVPGRFNVEWKATDDGASIPFQPLFN